MGYKIICGPLLFLAGLYYFLYAYRLAERLKFEAGAIYLFLGVFGMMVGVALIIQGIASM